MTENFWNDNRDFYIIVQKTNGLVNDFTPEEFYQAIKSRLMSECSVIERMTQEQYEEWKKGMVVKK